MSNLCTCVECMPDSQEPEMSNEDKMRESFSVWWEEHGQFCRAGGGHYEETFAYESWKACAAIKDAEITGLRETADQHFMVGVEAGKNEYREQLINAEKEIADLQRSVKELRQEATDYMHAIGILFAPQPKGDCLAERRPSRDLDSYNAFIYLNEQSKLLKQALANSEHHNSRALEKMLLEARKQEREYWADKFSDALQGDLENGVKWLNEEASKEFNAKYPELNKVLAELNKE